MDFFSVDVPKLTHSPAAEVTDPFAAAIGRRFSTAGAPLLTSRLPLPPPTPSATLPSPPSSTFFATPPRAATLAPAPPAPDLAAYAPLLPAALAPTVPNTLVLDIRPHNAYVSSRLPHALNLCVPSTLLKRPAFSLAKLSQMLPTASVRAAFAAWQTASRIIVYDADTVRLDEKSNVLGLLRKFEREGFTGSLAFVCGGFTAVWKQRRDLIDEKPLSKDSDSDAYHDTEMTSADATAPVKNTFLFAQDLPMAAFQQVSTTSAHRAPPPTPRAAVPPPLFSNNSNIRSPPPAPSITHPHPHTGTHSHGSARAPTLSRAVPFNPFFDNIRQNVELAGGITERIPLSLPTEVRMRHGDMPFDWLRNLIVRSNEETVEALAMQFFRIELGEQRRLQGVMEHHSRDSGGAWDDHVLKEKEREERLVQWGKNQRSHKTKTGGVDLVHEKDVPFPYSITAGIEQGAKNRYRNIWPFEHARVKLLNVGMEEGGDYVNASYIQPRGTSKKYIATQGPLPSTYNDFWTLCWEQNVRLIVMLTKQVENNQIKCGSYWTDTVYGPLRLRLISVEGGHDEAPPNPFAGAFDLKMSTCETENESMIIRRTFELSHTLFPAEPPRRIVQLQYLGWPDLIVPETPKALLELVDEAGAVMDGLRDEAKKAKSAAKASASSSSSSPSPSKKSKAAPRIPEPGPMLVHCSAGVGRTGSFVAVDAVLDGIKREMRALGDKSEQDRAQLVSKILDTQMQGVSVTHGMSPSSPPSSSSPASVPSGGRAASNKPKSSSSVSSYSAATSASQPPSLASFGAGFADLSMMSEEGEGRRRQNPSTLMSSAPSSRSPTPPKEVPQAQAFDFTVPRKIRHARPSPPMIASDEDPLNNSSAGSTPSSDLPSPLSLMDEPIRQVLEGIREQRMSMCQSLRQYVFVHQAILAGVVKILDEHTPKVVNEPLLNATSPASSLDIRNSSAEEEHATTGMMMITTNTSAAYTSADANASNSNNSNSSNSDSAGTVKRRASPTELAKVGSRGEVERYKRPSLKRRGRSEGSLSLPPSHRLQPPHHQQHHQHQDHDSSSDGDGDDTLRDIYQQQQDNSKGVGSGPSASTLKSRMSMSSLHQHQHNHHSHHSHIQHPHQHHLHRAPPASGSGLGPKASSSLPASLSMSMSMSSSVPASSSSAGFRSAVPGSLPPYGGDKESGADRMVLDR